MLVVTREDGAGQRVAAASYYFQMYNLVWTLHRECAVAMRGFVGESMKHAYVDTFVMSGSPQRCGLLLLAHSMHMLNDVRSKRFGAIIGILYSHVPSLAGIIPLTTCV